MNYFLHFLKVLMTDEMKAFVLRDSICVSESLLRLFSHPDVRAKLKHPERSTIDFEKWELKMTELMTSSTNRLDKNSRRVNDVNDVNDSSSSGSSSHHFGPVAPVAQDRREELEDRIPLMENPNPFQWQRSDPTAFHKLQ